MNDSAAKPPCTPGKKRMALHRADHDPRAAALVALAAVLDGQTDSQAAVDAALAASSLVPTDKRLCTELVYGTLRQYIRLEWFASRFLKKPEKLPREMYLALLIALYEMTFLRIPPHATVSWAVAHVRNRFGQGLAGVANGSLRSMQRSLPEFHRPSLYAKTFADPLEQLACLYAMPVWIVRLWHTAYGLDDTLSLLHASHETAPTGLRLNRLRPDWQTTRAALLQPVEIREYDAGEPLPEVPAQKNTPNRRMKIGTEATALIAALLLEKTKDASAGGSVETIPPMTREHPHVQGVMPVGSCALAFGGALPWQARALVKDGGAQRQSAASFAVLEEFTPENWPTPIWDCCAGRGGKTFALLERGIPVALAGDNSAVRLASFRQELTRHGLEEQAPRLVLGSAQDIYTLSENSDLPNAFGTILIDAPCSGLGTLARRPEIRLRRSPADIAGLMATQSALLRAAAGRIRPGGCLIYLTCTRNRGENQEQISTFLADHSHVKLEKEYQTLADSPLREFFYGARLRFAQ